jgi:hypothetical protein
MISGAPNPEEFSTAVKRANENHLANRLRYSLRVSVMRFATRAQLLVSWLLTYHPAGLRFCLVSATT